MRAQCLRTLPAHVIGTNHAAPDIHGCGRHKYVAVYPAAAAMGDAPIDVLINNAGIMIEDDIDRVDIAAARLQFEVNALGPLNVALPSGGVCILGRGLSIFLAVSDRSATTNPATITDIGCPRPRRTC